MDVNEIFNNVMKDPTLMSTLDIDKLLETVENERNDYLENKTTTSINTEIYETISNLGLKPDTFDKLIGYRFVDEIHELHKGKHVRWIRKNTGKLTNGGIVMEIKFLDNGTQILCMNSQNRFIQYKFDDCCTFQKLSIEEQLILMAYENLGLSP
jgi:uncharacterized protein YukJ